MMKIDALTLGAVGFALFAAWYTFKPGMGKPGATGEFERARKQAAELTRNTYANTAEFFDGSGAWRI